MQVLFIVLGFMGLTMTYFGGQWFLRSFKTKEIISFPLSQLQKEFEIINPGLFNICVLGGEYVNNTGNFTAIINPKGYQQEILLKEISVKPRFRKHRKIGVEYFQFKISDAGVYTVDLRNSEDLMVKKSMLILKRTFQSPLPIGHIQISINETIPIPKKFFGILLLVVGVNLSFWGILLGIHPELLG